MLHPYGIFVTRFRKDGCAWLPLSRRVVGGVRSHGAAGHGGGWNQASEAPRRRNQYNLTPPPCLASRLHRIYVALLGRHQFRSYLEMCISKYLVILERQNVAFPHVNENLKSNAVDILFYCWRLPFKMQRNSLHTARQECTVSNSSYHIQKYYLPYWKQTAVKLR